MRTSERIAIDVPPIFLRLVLAVTFLWAGLGKILGDMTVEGPAAQRLAAMGVDLGQDAAPPPADPDAEGDLDAVADPDALATPDAAAIAAGEPYTVQRLYGLSLLMANAANPPADDDGRTPRSIWPPAAATGSWPVYLAWAAAITELVAGLFMLIGFLTRLSAIALAGVMAVAMWLTEIGAAIQAQNTVLGFLPAGRIWYSPADWSTLLWQLSLLGIALALVFAGAGAVSADRALFGKPRDRGDEFEEDGDRDDERP